MAIILSFFSAYGDQKMKQIFWYRGEWLPKEPMVSGPLQIAFWSAAPFLMERAIKGALPDIDLHCARVVRSQGYAPISGLEPSARGIVRQAVRRLPQDLDYYIRPMFFSLVRDWPPKGTIRNSCWQSSKRLYLILLLALHAFPASAVMQLIRVRQTPSGMPLSKWQRALKEARERGLICHSCVIQMAMSLSFRPLTSGS